MRRRATVLFLSLTIFLFVSRDMMAAERLALVIGNASYKSAPLKNPVNDANDMAAALKNSGFDITLKLNVSKRQMDRAVKDFGKILKNTKGTGLFYFAGHGVQMNGRNYLVATDAQIESESDLEYEALDVGRVLGKMEDAENGMNIVILDACRNNPFARSFRAFRSGLAQMDAPKGTLIAYATSPGSFAADGDGRNGIYTKHLVQNMRQPGLTIEQVFKKVRMAVVAETSQKQVPWESSSIMGSFYFNPKKKSNSEMSYPNVNQQSNERTYEIVFWESIKDSSNAADFEAYLKQYPNGVFVSLAKNKLKQAGVPEKTKTPVSQKKVSEIKSLPDKDVSPKIASIASKEKDPNIVEKDGHYIKYKNGIVYDEKTQLEWYADTGNCLNWGNAKSWAKTLNLNGGRWRLPSSDELKTLYKKGSGLRNMTPLLNTTDWIIWTNWSQSGMYQVAFFLKYGYSNTVKNRCERAFAVRRRY